MNEEEATIEFLKSLVSAGDLTGEELAYRGAPLESSDITPAVEVSEWGGRTIPEIEAMREEYETTLSKLKGRVGRTLWESWESNGLTKLPKFFVWNWDGKDNDNYPLEIAGVELDYSRDVVNSMQSPRFLSWVGFANFTRKNGKKSFITTVFSKVTGDGTPIEPYHKTFGKTVGKEDIVHYYNNVLGTFRDTLSGNSATPPGQ